MNTIQKYVIPENRIVKFIRDIEKYDVSVILSYSFSEVFGDLYLVVYVSIQPGEIPHDLKVEKMKEYYSRYQKTIPNE